MAHAAHINMIPQDLALDKKAYAVSIKGLIKHTKDIFFSEKKQTSLDIQSRGLSPHLLRDIGMM
ncbi:hypothetical protein HWV00_11115 [Moritella sp. 24]|uniref:hypothetical protein n=1 Tax=Moritella sp. 24 TaxID=2746230 RepID=UPI001BAA553D|nr:hypothetical protein [Moritella sp. 24]QUM76737.1 hypothetical protein HWV00_11115 [Moritella sp. 24]